MCKKIARGFVKVALCSIVGSSVVFADHRPLYREYGDVEPTYLFESMEPLADGYIYFALFNVATVWRSRAFAWSQTGGENHFGSLHPEYYLEVTERTDREVFELLNEDGSAKEGVECSVEGNLTKYLVDLVWDENAQLAEVERRVLTRWRNFSAYQREKYDKDLLCGGGSGSVGEDDKSMEEAVLSEAGGSAALHFLTLLRQIKDGGVVKRDVYAGAYWAMLEEFYGEDVRAYILRAKEAQSESETEK